MEASNTLYAFAAVDDAEAVYVSNEIDCDKDVIAVPGKLATEDEVSTQNPVFTVQVLAPAALHELAGHAVHTVAPAGV